jgi:1,4-dihydroxy-2-naphthoate octaprenyltransferase
MKIGALIRLGRPLFLGGGFILFALGSVMAQGHAVAGHSIDVSRYIIGQCAVTAFQLMTHYANDYFDYEADQANQTPTKWSGGSRVLPAGELPRHVALVAAIVLAILGLTATAALASTGSLWLLVAIVVLAWSYSAPPLRLCARGLGELTTAIVVTVLVPLLGFTLQRGDATKMLALTIAPLAMLQFAMLLAIEFPDAAGDAMTGKRTLVVKLGARPAAVLYVAITLLAFVWPAIAYACGLPGHVAALMAVPAPIAIWRIVRIAEHADASAFERLTFWAVFLLVSTSALALLGWVT